MPEIRLELFGGLRATVDGRPAPRFRTHRSAALAAYLAVCHKRRHSREVIGELLWPDEDPVRQRSRLRYELTQLRATLGPDFLADEDRQHLAVHPQVQADVLDFDRAVLESVRAADPQQRVHCLEKAVRIAHDDLLPDYLDDWVLAERQRLNDECHNALLRLLLDLETLGRDDDAVRVRRTIAARFPERPAPLPVAAPAASPASPLYGRDHDLARVRHALDAERRRLVTLTGPGGVGKTRLARELARARDHRFVSFEQSGDVSSFWEIVADALGAAGPLPARARALRDLAGPDPPLLVLDNLEHLVPAVAGPIDEMLAACPRLQCLATSQRPLRHAREVEIPLAPLSETAAKALFLHRARLARPDFATLERGIVAVLETVRMLEGLPLAIELAAARAVVLGPRQIRDQLDQRLEFLVRVHPGDTPPRHHGIRAALDWSVGLLAPDRRRALMALSVFRDGFTLDAAEAVCRDLPRVLDTLEDLQSQSLLTVAFTGEDETARYALRDLVREYAGEIADDALRGAARDRHRDHYAAALRAAGDSLPALLRRDRENLLHAQEHALATGHDDTLLALFDHAALRWFESGLRSRFLQVLDAVEPRLEREGPSPRLARLLGLRAADARRQGDEASAAACWERRLAVFRTLGDIPGVTNTLCELAAQACDAGRVDDGRRWLDEAHALLGDAERYDSRTIVAVLDARLAARAGDRGRAARALEDAQALQTAPVTEAVRIYARTYLAIVRHAIGDPGTQAALREALRTTWDSDQPFATGLIALEMARFHRARGERTQARHAYRIAAGIHADLQSRLERPCADEERTFLAAEDVPDPHGAAQRPWRELLADLLL